MLSSMALSYSTSVSSHAVVIGELEGIASLELERPVTMPSVFWVLGVLIHSPGPELLSLERDRGRRASLQGPRSKEPLTQHEALLTLSSRRMVSLFSARPAQGKAPDPKWLFSTWLLHEPERDRGMSECIHAQDNACM